ncbi:MAG: histidine triad nucleotide-binding protein [Gemmatimonadota bacterium]
MGVENCVFCRIVAGEIPAEVVHRDEEVLAFQDLSPQAPVHILIIPRRHVPSLAELDDDDGDLAGRLLLVARQVARDQGVEANGFRLVANTGADGGQSVDHLHFHLLGGRSLGWPPG